MKYVHYSLSLFRSLEYDPRFYGMFFHDDVLLPMDASMWDHLDETISSGYQDSLVLHMIHKPVQVSFQKEEERYMHGYCNVFI